MMTLIVQQKRRIRGNLNKPYKGAIEINECTIHASQVKRAIRKNGL